MRIVVSGSIAYDYIMVFPGQFKDHILPDKVHVLSVSFLVETLKKMRGGTAPNIAYNLALLGAGPAVLGTVGQDFGEYSAWLSQRGVDTSLIEVIADDFTSSCFVNTDLSANQITAFYPGAMAHAHTQHIHELAAKPDFVIIAPNDPAVMGQHADECRAQGIPYMYDPSMQAPRMTGEALKAGAAGARILIGNDYEFAMMAEKIGCTEDELRRLVPLTIVTKGAEGATIYADGEVIEIPAADTPQVVDPTGAGDAFRAGFVRGFLGGLPLAVAGRMASLAAVYAIEQRGAQEHAYSAAEFVERYAENFGASPELASLFGTEVAA
ncbi:MAG TPA: carbohydrate kinase family protein [Herpetosiphonaceae bacterium]